MESSFEKALEQRRSYDELSPRATRTDLPGGKQSRLHMAISDPTNRTSPRCRWISVSDQKELVCYYEPVLQMQTFWIDLKRIDFAAGTSERIPPLTENRQTYVGDVTDRFTPAARPFQFLLEK